MNPLLKSKGNKPRKGVVITCTLCAAERYVGPARAKLYKRPFCSKAHMIEYLKKNAFSFDCLICGKRVLTQPTQIKYRNRHTCSRKCRDVERHQQALERRKTYTKHQLDRLARYSPEAEKWRKEIFARDDYTCQDCGIRGTYLEADHIKPFAYFPELRFELSNGRTLCRKCHDKTKIGYKKMREIWGQPIANYQEKLKGLDPT